MADAGPPGASSNGFNENLALFNSGKCGMWIDATVAASFVTNPKDSTVADKVGFALAPDNGLGKRGNWLWAWSLAVPAGSQKAEAAQKFVVLGDQQGLHRARRCEGRLGQCASRHAHLALHESRISEGALRQDDARLDQLGRPNNPTVKPVPYVGVQFVAIPEFQGIATTVGQIFSAALAGEKTADEALAEAQDAATREMTKAGYIK